MNQIEQVMYVSNFVPSTIELWNYGLQNVYIELRIYIASREESMVVFSFRLFLISFPIWYCSLSSLLVTVLKWLVRLAWNDISLKKRKIIALFFHNLLRCTSSHVLYCSRVYQFMWKKDFFLHGTFL